MKKTMISLLALLCLGSAAYAQAVPKTKTRNRDKQGVIMSDSPNTIAPVTPADRTGSKLRTDSPNRVNNTRNATRQQNSLDNEPLNTNTPGRVDRNPELNQGEMDRRTNEILNNSSIPTQPPPTK